MTTLRPDPNEELARKINELLPEGAKVFVHQREVENKPTLHCLIFQHGSRRHVVEEQMPFTEADIGMIVNAVERWVNLPRQRNRSNAWTEDPAVADALIVG